MAISDAEIIHTGGESTESLSGKLNFEQDKNRIIGRDSSALPRLIILADGSEFEMKISEPSQDVTTATNDNLIFNSNQNILKIVQTDTVTVPNPGSGTFTQSSVEIDTGIVSVTALMCTAFIINSGYSNPLPFFSPALNGTYGGFLWSYQASTRVVSGTVRFRVDCNNFDVVSGPGTATIKYYILQETAA